MAGDPRELLSSALKMWWLRPENGLAIASYVYRGVDLSPGEGRKAADFACGDGVNTFFKVGGRFKPTFDLFGTAVRADRARDVVIQHVDVFDHFNEDYAPEIERRPKHGYAFGTDHKANLLKKAEKLGFYAKLLEADLAKDTPIEEESLDLLYCNSLYWTPHVEEAVEHMYRKVKSGGFLVFDVMTAHRVALHFQHLMPTLPPAWQSLMNRGRDVNNPGIRSEHAWKETFARDGLAVVEDVRCIFPAAIAHAWNIGLRPMFPLLNRMAGAIPHAERQSIKEEWVELWTELLFPLLVEPDEFTSDRSRVRLQYVVRKK